MGDHGLFEALDLLVPGKVATRNLFQRLRGGLGPIPFQGQIIPFIDPNEHDSDSDCGILYYFKHTPLLVPVASIDFAFPMSQRCYNRHTGYFVFIHPAR